MTSYEPTATSDFELEDSLEFFKFSHDTKNPYRGVVCFQISYPDGSETSRIVAVDPEKGVQIYQGEKDKDIPPLTCHAIMNRETFFDVYQAKIHPSNAVLSGKVKVKGWKFRELSNWACAFDMRTEKWNEFYAWRGQPKVTNSQQEESKTVSEDQKTPLLIESASSPETSSQEISEEKIEKLEESSLSIDDDNEQSQLAVCDNNVELENLVQYIPRSLAYSGSVPPMIQFPALLLRPSFIMEFIGPLHRLSPDINSNNLVQSLALKPILQPKEDILPSSVRNINSKLSISALVDFPVREKASISLQDVFSPKSLLLSKRTRYSNSAPNLTLLEMEPEDTLVPNSQVSIIPHVPVPDEDPLPPIQPAASVHWLINRVDKGTQAVDTILKSDQKLLKTISQIDQSVHKLKFKSRIAKAAVSQRLRAVKSEVRISIDKKIVQPIYAHRRDAARVILSAIIQMEQFRDKLQEIDRRSQDPHDFHLDVLG